MRVSMYIVVDVFDVGAMQLFKSDLDVVVHEVGLLSQAQPEFLAAGDRAPLDPGFLAAEG
jgi:hypothetical protein